MSPEAVLMILARAWRRPSAGPSAPFLLQSINRSHSFLSHPMLAEGGFLVDDETSSALHTLVRVGYLAQPEQGNAYRLTAAGLDYAARLEGTWDGIERRQHERRINGQHPAEAEHRRAERRLGVSGA
jgi:hypothetical protein